MHGSKAASTAFDIEHIPEAMKAEPRWVCWKAEFRDGKWTKVPVNPLFGSKARSNDPTTWGRFDSAVSHASRHGYGIGFMLGDGWLGVDIDECRMPDGEPEPWVAEWLSTHRAYAEWSVGGSGVHVITKGTTLPEWSANRRGPVEVYEVGRFFTVSGKAMFRDRGTEPIQGPLEALCRARLADPPMTASERPRASAGLVDRSAEDWAVVCDALKRGVSRDVVEAILRTKMEADGRGEKARRPDYIPNTVDKAERTLQLSPRAAKPIIAEPRVLVGKPFRLDREPALREVIVEGLVRRGEVCNWIGAPKTGKSWLMHRLIMGMVSGVGFPGGRGHCIGTKRGKVLLVDVELHAETLEHRLWRTAEQVGVCERDLENLSVLVGRGESMTLDDLEATIEAAGKGCYQAIVLDAFYRFIPAGMSENENADMTQLYNQIDRIAKAGD